MDVTTANGEGWNFVRALKSSYPHVPIVVIIPKGDSGLAQQALAEGAFDYLIKPINMSSSPCPMPRNTPASTMSK